MSQLPAVLIVDDDEIHQYVAKAMIRRIGYPVLSALDGFQALAMVEEHGERIGCVMLDVNMPRMSGVEVLRRLRALDGHIEVFVASGFLTEANRRELEPYRPRGYIAKPLVYQRLAEELTALLGGVEVSPPSAGALGVVRCRTGR